jgi:hypothetical protein
MSCKARYLFALPAVVAIAPTGSLSRTAGRGSRSCRSGEVIGASAVARDVSERKQLKRDLKAGRVSIGALLLDPPPFLETAKVVDMLLALPRHGSVKATKILHSCRVSPSTTFGA